MYSLSYLWAKLVKKLRGSAIINSELEKTSYVGSGSHIVSSKFGKYSYCGYNCQIINCKIGAFCSLADNIVIGGARHPIEWTSMSPLFYRDRSGFGKKFAEFPRIPDKITEIGNDVWIGNNVIIIQGIKIGNGAVIGAGSVVTKDVDPYTIVAGNPARLIRKRFDNETIEILQQSHWWDMPEANIAIASQYIKSPKDFIKHLNLLNESMNQ